MPKAVTIYRWDDEGAPQFVTGKYSEIIAVLDACLLTGYGNKQPLGWTKLFSESVACCYKNASGGCVVFSSNTGTDDAKGTYVQAAQSATNGTNLVRPGWKQSIKVFPNHNVSWVVIGTDSAVYLFFGYVSKYEITSYKYIASAFFGDLSHAITNDAGKFVAICSLANEDFSLDTSSSISSNTGRNIDHLNHLSPSSSPGVKIYDADAANEFTLYLPDAPYLPVSQSSINNLGAITSNSLMAVTLKAKDLEVAKDRSGEFITASTTRPACRGALPGLFNTLCAHPFDVVWPSLVNYGGQQHLILRVTTPTRASKLILNVELWND
ncbi:hypothetical protein [Pseudoalteromonas obscura]|uniref:Uncharacterized protein n=1 Tax=Pseudoalteromonas obscura TaxID=3048491 RepID=A0ABT7EUE8_9GAMM|nr:hypothetical protein [Pseudoalteromonas sp. P94(2023)]MDK2598666.1 hypothetical protein [Pseudoalteromonas sp. P94(2023)]